MKYNNYEKQNYMWNRDRINNRRRGAIYEEIAADYLEEKGYKILKRNYANRYGELDLIAVYHRNPDVVKSRTAEEMLFIPGTLLVVVEVKYRTWRTSGDPAEAVTPGKMKHICRTTVGFYLEEGLTDSFPCRFDVISIYADGSIRHIEDAFLFR